MLAFLKHYTHTLMVSSLPVFQADKLDSSTDVLRALAHPLRMELVSFIRSKGSVSVQEIYQTLDIEQSLTSQHLSVLRQNNLVDTERQGKHVNYRVNEEKYDHVLGAVDRFLSESLATA